jgi:hypothetical protein
MNGSRSRAPSSDAHRAVTLMRVHDDAPNLARIIPQRDFRAAFVAVIAEPPLRIDGRRMEEFTALSASQPIQDGSRTGAPAGRHR